MEVLHETTIVLETKVWDWSLLLRIIVYDMKWRSKGGEREKNQ